MLVLDDVRDGKAYKNPVLKKSCVEESNFRHPLGKSIAKYMLKIQTSEIKLRYYGLWLGKKIKYPH